jgi:hypothetical protein
MKASGYNSKLDKIPLKEDISKTEKEGKRD